jgi:monofunctional biosynthetic peptidoglycan transglycosylase
MSAPERQYGSTKTRSLARFPLLPRWLRVAVMALLAVLLVPYALAPLYRVVDPPSTVMLWRAITGQRVEATTVPLTAIAPILPRTVIVSEDGRFCWHHGIDFRELRAVIADADDLDDMRGGSTLTQQVAKNLFLWPGRSIVRKLLEFPLALWIDLVLPKQRIMEIYLNIAEWGPNGEFGVEAGAQRAFRKSASRLTAYEAALLAAVLPNPVKRKAGAPGPGLRRLAGIYVRRAARSPQSDFCLRGGHDPAR